MTLKEVYTRGRNLLEQKEIPDADLDAWYLLEHITGISRALYFVDSGRELDGDQEDRYFELIKKRGQRIPLQHLTGIQEFMGFPFQVNEHVLIPRQDTETLVEEALSILQKKKESVYLLDMCTGSGCILLSILKSMTSGGIPIRGIGVELSEKALETAARNAEMLKVNAEFLRSDLFENVEGRFSMIVSNPPYIRTAEIVTLQEEVKKHDPVMALDGGEDGLFFYRKIIWDSRDHLMPGGDLLFEIGCNQALEVSELMHEAGFQKISVKKDLAGLDRVVSGVYDDKM